MSRKNEQSTLTAILHLETCQVHCELAAPLGEEFVVRFYLRGNVLISNSVNMGTYKSGLRERSAWLLAKISLFVRISILEVMREDACFWKANEFGGGGPFILILLSTRSEVIPKYFVRLAFQWMWTWKSKHGCSGYPLQHRSSWFQNQPHPHQLGGGRPRPQRDCPYPS